MRDDRSIEGVDIPVHRALTEPIFLGGAPRSVAILNGTFAAAIGLGLHQCFAGLGVFFIGHTLAVFAATRDPYFIPVLARHLRQKIWWLC